MFGRWGVNYVRLGVVLEDATTCYHMHTRVGRSCHMHRHFIPDFHFSSPIRFCSRVISVYPD